MRLSTLSGARKYDSVVKHLPTIHEALVQFSVLPKKKSSPKGFYLYGSYVLIFTELEIKTENFKITNLLKDNKLIIH